MSSFTKPFKVIVHNVPLKDKPFEINERFEFYSEENNGYTIYIPKGYRTDFATVPRFLWSLVPPVGRWSKATIVHDWLIDNPTEHNLGINQINTVLNESMKELDVRWRYRQLIFRSVDTYWRLRSLIGFKWNK